MVEMEMVIMMFLSDRGEGWVGGDDENDYDHHYSQRRYDKKVLLLLRQEKRSSWKQMEIIGQLTESLFHQVHILWSWAAEVISLCPFSIQYLAFNNSFDNKPPRSAHGYVMECYNKQDRIFGSLTKKEFGFTWSLRSQVSINGARQRPLSFFRFPNHFRRRKKSIAFKTDESNLFKKH